MEGCGVEGRMEGRGGWKGVVWRGGWKGAEGRMEGWCGGEDGRVRRGGWRGGAEGRMEGWCGGEDGRVVQRGGWRGAEASAEHSQHGWPESGTGLSAQQRWSAERDQADNAPPLSSNVSEEGGGTRKQSHEFVLFSDADTTATEKGHWCFFFFIGPTVSGGIR